MPLLEKFSLFFDKGFFGNFLIPGLKVTLQITLGAAVIGIIIGVLIALVRVTHDKTAGIMRPGLGRVLLIFLNQICKLCITVFRGIPVVVQILIWFFIILISIKSKIAIAVIGFGINSAVYVAEIIRAGIMSVDAGQMEAGRSLGLNYIQTMRYIILPQAFKNVLPTLCNEFIVLLKETAIVGYIAVPDLTMQANRLVGLTYDAIVPLGVAAMMYLTMVMILEKLFNLVERRLRASDSR